MFINEYGNKNSPLVLLLAPMMVSGEDLYQLMNPYFKHNYHYIAPDQGGHGKAGALRNIRWWEYEQRKSGEVFKTRPVRGNADADWRLLDRRGEVPGRRQQPRGKRFHAKGMLFPGIIFALIPAALVGGLVTLIR